MSATSHPEVSETSKIVSFKSEFKKNIFEVIGLVMMLMILFAIFGAAGNIAGNFIEKIEQVRSLGDAKVIYPLSYIYFVGMAFVLLSHKGSGIHKYFLSICSLASSGLFFFFSLMAAYRFYFYQSLTAGTFIVIILFLIITVAVDAISRYLEGKATNRNGRIIAAMAIFSASVGLLIDPSSV